MTGIARVFRRREKIVMFGDKKIDFRKLADISSIGLLLPSSIAVGLFFGYVLDKWLGSHPWMLLIFLLLGIVSGLMSLFRAIKKYDKDNTE